MSSNIEEQATAIYVFVDDFLKAHPHLAHWRASNNHQPAFTDAEVLTIGLMQGCFGVATLRKTYDMVHDNLSAAFPELPTYKQWLRRLHQLSALSGHLMRAALSRTCLGPMRLYLLDSKPVPLSKPIRHGRVRLLREEGAYFGKTSAGWFFGYKVHAITHVSGAVIAALLLPANEDDRTAALALGWSVGGGIGIGDWGYSGSETFDLLYDEADLVLVKPADAGDRGTRARAVISSVRERIETSFRQLWDRFVDRVYSRSWEGLWSTIKLKLAHLNLCYAGIVSI